ncbi:MAG: nucleotidyltransferase domain-containing protein [Acidobacteriota bacterium]|jgi:predicted nucleotidyltransferase
MPQYRNERLQSYFADRPELGVVAVWLFGSWAAERSRRENQLAVGALLGPWRERDPRARRRTRELLDEELSAVAEEPVVELVILNDAPPIAAHRIVTEGRLLLSTDPEAERAFLRDVQLRSADLEIFLRTFRRARTPVLAR